MSVGVVYIVWPWTLHFRESLDSWIDDVTHGDDPRPIDYLARFTKACRDDRNANADMMRKLYNVLGAGTFCSASRL